MMDFMKPRTSEMIEGPEALERFRKAAKIIMAFPKTALPPDPFGKRKREKKTKPTAKKT